MGEVGGAVEGIDNPSIWGVCGPVLPALLGKDPMARVGGENGAHDAFFRASIRIGHKVDGRLIVDAKSGADMLHEHGSGCFGRSNCGRKK